MFLLKAFHWITLVQQDIQEWHQHQNHAHVMLCLTNFFWLQQKIFCHNWRTQQMHNWIVEATKNHVLKVAYSMGEYIWMLWALNIYHIIIFIANIYYYWPWCESTWTQKRCIIWPHHFWKMFLFQLISTVEILGQKGMIHRW